MVVITKSKSHPDLLLFSSPRFCEGSCWSDTDSVSSLEFAGALKVSKDGTGSATSISSSPDPRRAIGKTLWKLLLQEEIRFDDKDSETDATIGTNISAVDWNSLRTKHKELDGVSDKDLNKYLKALSSIVILRDDARTREFLADFQAQLLDVSPTITRGLYHQQNPDTYHAYVADFNDNLAYAMRTQRGIPKSSELLEWRMSCMDTTAQAQDEWDRQVEKLEQSLQRAMTRNSTTNDANNSTTTTSAKLDIQTSYLKTDHQTIPQPCHVDFAWNVLDEHAHHMRLAFFPLTQEGMILQVWKNNTTNSCSTTTSSTNPKPQQRGILVFVPLGKLLLAPSDILHGGGFRTTPIFNDHHKGNVRYHLYVSTQQPLPPFAQNIYTLRNDKRHELSEVYWNAPGLEKDDDDGDDDAIIDNDNDNALLMDLLLE